MPKNKGQKIKNQKNDASILEEPTTLKPSKAADYSENLNQINKNEG